MGIKHAITRKTFEVTIDGAMKYINKDRETNLLKLVDMAQKIMGGSYPDYVFDNARELFSHPEEKWMQFMYKSLDELDPNIVKMHVRTCGNETCQGDAGKISVQCAVGDSHGSDQCL